MLAGAVRVGELACQRNTFLKELTSTVLSCEPVQSVIKQKANNDTSNKTKAKNNNNNKNKNRSSNATSLINEDPSSANVSSASTDNKSACLYEVILSDSILFPEGGGQPCDYGILELCSHDGGASKPITITTVLRKGDLCVLHSPVPLPLGAEVRSCVDWPRRWDHAQQHTGQHLLSAVIERYDMMHLDTVSWSLTHPYCFIVLDVQSILNECCEEEENNNNDNNNDSSSLENNVQSRKYKSYLTSEKKINDAMIQRIEDACNEAIRQALPVEVNEFSDKTTYSTFVESLSPLLNNDINNKNNHANKDDDNGNSSNNKIANSDIMVRSRGIPDDVHGPIRLISIDKGRIDQCTCCGTHLTNLAQLQMLQILHQEVKGTLVKLYFITGERALGLFGKMFWRERALIAAMEGAKAEDFVSITQRRAKEQSDTSKKIKQWMLELAEAKAQELITMLNSESNKAIETELAKSNSYNNIDNNNIINNNSTQICKHATRVLCLRRDDVEGDYFQYIRNKLDEHNYKHVILVAAWAIDCGNATASYSVVPARDVQGQLFITGGVGGSDGKHSPALTVVIDKVQTILTGVKGGLSRMGYRGKGSLKEWKKLVDELDNYVKCE